MSLACYKHCGVVVVDVVIFIGISSGMAAVDEVAAALVV